MLETCENGGFLNEILNIPLYIYVHGQGEGCPVVSVEAEYSFPNYFYCNGCDQVYNLLNYIQPDHSVLIRKQRYKRYQSVSLNTYLQGFDYYGNFTCNQRSFEQGRITRERYCFTGNYILSFLQSELNFTIHPVNSRTPIQITGFGKISQLIHDDFSVGQSRLNFLLSEREVTVLYCDFSPPRTSKISFRAWWAPYRLNVWGWFSSSLLGLSLALTYCELIVKNRDITQNKLLKGFLTSWCDRLLEVIRFILRQDDSQGFFLIICSYFMLIFTCLYENIITSQLIVPDEVLRYKDIIELTKHGYSITVQAEGELFYERKLPDSYNQTLAEHFQRHGKSMEDFYEGVKFVFYDLSDQTYLIDMGNVSLKYASLQMNDKISLSFMEQYLSKLHGRECHRVRNSASKGFKLMFLYNFLVYEQLELMQLLRDRGFISWWFQLQEFSQKMYLSHWQRDVEEIVDDKGSSYISNMNVVPIYTVWFAFNLVGMVVFAFERKYVFDSYQMQKVYYRILKMKEFFSSMAREL
jgi:hypothetical protein